MAKPDRRRDAGSGAGADRVRIDKWLWAARFFKSRSVATQAVDAGQARCNGERVKPAHPVRAGDTIAVRRSGFEFVVVVLALSERRGSAAIAATLYRETDASRQARETAEAANRAASGADPRFPGRPTKRDRRQLDDFKRKME